MKIRGLLIAVVILAALVGVLYWSNNHKPAETTEASANTPPKILSLKEDDISKIAIEKSGSPQLALTKTSGKWQITAPQTLPADQTAVSPMLSTLSSLTSDRLVEEKAADLTPYGLAHPPLEVDVTEKNNKTQKLLLGDATPTGNSIYAKLADDPRVFTLATYQKTSIDKTPDDVRDKRLLTVDAEKISRVELIANKQDIEFGRNKDEWQIVKPKPLRADGTQVEELLRTLTDAKMDLSSSPDEKKLASTFASATPVASAKVTDESGTQELQVRKAKDDYYAKSSTVDGIYKVASTVGTGLSKNLDDFRNKKLFDFGFTDPNKIEIHDGAKSYVLTRNGSDWWNSTGGKLDVGTVETVLDKLRDLTSSKFVDSGFTTPAIDATVTSGDGKKVEKVLLAKSGDNYIAQRENEPALYQVDGKAVTDLEKAAQDLKPAAPPAKSGK